jgi:phospholipase/carboxylesterase
MEQPIYELIHTTLGSLRCAVLTHPHGASPQLALVLCHGFGAPGDDLVPLGGEVFRREPQLTPVRLVFPEAPVQLAPEFYGNGRAWWPLDVERLIERQARGMDLTDFQEEVPEGLSKARRSVVALVDELARQTALPISRIVLGGFSQGAMVSLDVALHLEDRPSGVILLSGTLLARSEWERRARKRAGLPVFQSHGRQDPLLPFSAAEALRDLLVRAGLQVEFAAFDGGHAIPPSVLDRTGQFLLARLRELNSNDKVSRR